MLKLFDTLKLHFKYLRHPTESFLFYLHYRVTFLALMSFCIIVSSKLMVGHPIICTPALPTSKVPEEVMNAYCWSHGTYSIGAAYEKKLGREIPHPGVDVSEDESDFIHRNYYQYIYFVLLLQAVLFYVPHGLWLRLENGEFGKMMESLKNVISSHEKNYGESEEKEDREKRQGMAKYRVNIWGCYNKYALQYQLCEILQLLNLVLQIWLLNVFFNGEFASLGLPQENLSYRELMDRVFPRVTKCHFKKFGPSGIIDTEDVLCGLPINAFNEKIYYVTWFWFFLLLILDLLNLSLSILTAIFPDVRAYRMSFNTNLGHFWKSPSPTDVESLVFNLTRKGNFGDWYMLSRMLTSMGRLDFRVTVKYLYNLLPDEKSENQVETLITEDVKEEQTTA